MVHGAHGKPLHIAGRTEHLDIQWGEARGRASFIVIVGLEAPPCLIGMDIMRPLRVRIDVTEGTATPAQPDPQTIHLNAAQTQQPQKRLLPRPTSSPPLPQGATVSGASLQTPRAVATPQLLPQHQGRSLAEAGNATTPEPAQTPVHPPGPPPTLLHRPTVLTLTRLAVLGCYRQQIFLPRQLALWGVTTLGHLRTSFFALMALSRSLWPAYPRSLVVQSFGMPCTTTGQSPFSFTQGKA